MIVLLTNFALVAAATVGTADVPPPADSSPKTSKPASAQQYCIEMDQVTGSRVRPTECHTKAQWMDRGVDVDELLANKGKPGGEA